MKKMGRSVFFPFGMTFALISTSIAGCGQADLSAWREGAPALGSQGIGVEDGPMDDDGSKPGPIDGPVKGDSCGPGQCTDGGYCDACGCYSWDSSVSITMCSCGLIDPACGLGFCDLGVYCAGNGCADSQCFAADSPISMTMCQGVALDPATCEPANDCIPETRNRQGGVDDHFSTANGAEPPSPSPGLMAWLDAHYPGILGFRDFDDPELDRFFAHTFTGLEPHGGQTICGARLHMRLHRDTLNNDGLWLRFVDASGTSVGPSWSDTLNNLGVPAGTGSIVVDLATLPNGAAFLAALQNGWLDMVIQDDTMVDYVALDVDYCCADCYDPHTPQLPNIVGYWSLDEATGPTSADLIQLNNGAWFGAPQPIPGIGCGALEFDGIQDYEITSTFAGPNFWTGDFSVSFYVKTMDQNLNVILDKRVEVSGPVRGWHVYTYNGSIGLQLADGTHTNFGTSAFVADGQWHHVAITVRRGSPTGIEVYLDKVHTNTFSPMGHPGSLSTKVPMTIGRRSDNPGSPGFLAGALDEISLYNRALTAAEIQTL